MPPNQPPRRHCCDGLPTPPGRRDFRMFAKPPPRSASGIRLGRALTQAAKISRLARSLSPRTAFRLERPPPPRSASGIRLGRALTQAAKISRLARSLSPRTRAAYGGISPCLLIFLALGRLSREPTCNRWRNPAPRLRPQGPEVTPVTPITPEGRNATKAFYAGRRKAKTFSPTPPSQCRAQASISSRRRARASDRR